jgi:hypothetical protein
MTWGQLRMQLQTAAPGVSLDLLDEFLNGRYEQVLEASDWQGLKYHYTIETEAAYQSSSDTVTLTVGSATVTGSGTNWTSTQLGNIPRFYRPGDTVIYTATYVSSTELTLDRPYEGVSGDEPGDVYSGAPYVLMQNVYALPSDARSIVSILDPITQWPLVQMTKDQLDASAGQRTLVEQPAYYAPYDDSNESNPPVIHQVELYPPPLYAQGFVTEYIHSATAFDGGNTSGSPLPWVSNTVLLMGCRADIAAYLAGQSANPAPYLAQAKYYQAQFDVELAKILRLEHWQKRAKVPMKMAPRFTRHRMARAMRGFNRVWGIGQGGPN